MVRARVLPNPENGSLADLRATMTAGCRETNRRCLTIIMSLTGIAPEQVLAALDLCESALRKIIRAFNLFGIDGLVAKKRLGVRGCWMTRPASRFWKNLKTRAKRNGFFGPPPPCMDT